MPRKRSKPKTDPESPKKRTSYTVLLDEAQMEKLEARLENGEWFETEVPHARFAFKGDRVNVTAYESGKCLIQGARTEDFVTDILEAEITLDPRLGYDEVHHPDWFELHAGVDESGKGDLFGPLVSATVVADGDAVRDWIENGVRDSKSITSDRQILILEKKIRATRGVVVHLSWARMRKYNELHTRFGKNLNRLLAWFHARSITAAINEKPAPWGLLDQFSKQPLTQRLLKIPGFELRMRTRAESDPVVAAASVCARAEYVRQMQALSEQAGIELRKGASAAVKQQAVEIIRKFGPDALPDYAKMHFKTANEALQLAS